MTEPFTGHVASVCDAAALRLQAALDAPSSSRQRVDLNDVRTLLVEHFELQSCGARACIWPKCLTETQQLELAKNVHRSMLGEDTGPDPDPGCDCAERKLAEAQVELKRLRALITNEHSCLSQDFDNAEEAGRRAKLLDGAPTEMIEAFRLNPAYAAQKVMRLDDEAKWLRARHDSLVARAEQAEAALAELRERLGEADEQWGVQGGGGTFAVLGEAEARWHMFDSSQPMTPVRRVVGEWRTATPRTALERAADERGVCPVRDISELAAGECGPTPEEFAAFDRARQNSGSDE